MIEVGKSDRLDIGALARKWAGRNHELHAEHVNPQFVKVLRTIGFDNSYVRAEGAHLWDTHGTQYLDLISGFGVFTMGRNHPEVRDTLIEFLGNDGASLVKLDAPLLSSLLAAELKKRMPNGLDMVYFGNSGAEGIETAIKFARCATRRPAILHCKKGFHGLSMGALSLNGDEAFRQGFAPYLPDCRMIPFNDLDALEKELRAGDVAAFVVEPVQGKGVHLPLPGYLSQAAALCRKHGALFVADEVQSGMGRTGRFLGIEHEPGLDPDIVVLSKALSGGYVPVCAVLTRRWIFDKVFSSMQRAVVHSATFGQGNLAMAAGLAALHVTERHRLAERAEKYGNLIGEGLRAMMPRFEFLKDVRWRGCMVGIEFGPPKSLGLKAAWTLAHTMDKSLFPQAAIIPLMEDHHILTQVGGHHIDVIKLLPPLVIDESDVRWFLEAFDKVLTDMHQFPGPVWEALSRIGKNALLSREKSPATETMAAWAAGAIAPPGETQQSATSSKDVSAQAAPLPVPSGGSPDPARRDESLVLPARTTDPASGPRHSEDRDARAATRHIDPPRTYFHTVARWMILPLVGTSVTPNHLTTMRLVTGILAAAMFAAGQPLWTAWGGILFILSALLDRADGELARVSRRASAGGHRYDTVCDALANVLVFVGIGIGLRAGPLGLWAVALGLVAGLSVGAIFWLIMRIEAAKNSKEAVFPGRGGFEPDDGLILIAPLGWLDLLLDLLVATSVGAPLFAFWTGYRDRRVLLARQRP